MTLFSNNLLLYVIESFIIKTKDIKVWGEGRRDIMEKVTYRNIHKEGKRIKESSNWIHVHNAEMLLQYDSNYIQFKTMPTIKEFEQAEEYLKAFHQKTGQKHLKFIFPENKKFTKELLDHIVHKLHYDVGLTELYAIDPSEFPVLSSIEDILIEKVTEANFEDYLQLEYNQDLEYGLDYAKGKTEIYRKNFKDSHFLQIIAYYKGKAAGALEAIIEEKTVEIDGIFVIEEFQRNGIAARMQKMVMDLFPEKTIILLADGEDTPREMYKKQNYQKQGFQYEALKEKYEGLISKLMEIL
ncbi:GNAT family N-acetyltransferase [Niallia sp.]|uniref:GNAT family N-acetyltransferase n=1 Tax=Niallia sp. TaxID=2837523 RepID=UPI00289BEED0|nr:GNAT family N-acetyltransferase [Niallia sp.]